MTRPLACAGHPVRDATAALVGDLWQAIWRWDHGTASHVERMSRYAAMIAGGVGFDDDHCGLIRLAAKLHDIGKLGMPDEILFKPGRLSPGEFAMVKGHAERGAALLGCGNGAVLGTAAVIARTHHERWDGTGYPSGLAGAQIPIEGRIAAVADVFDALVSRRVYKPAYPIERAFEVLTQGRGRHFDGELVDVFLASMDGAEGVQRRIRE